MDTKAHILYIEDDEVLGFVTRDNLEMNQYSVHHCKDGEEGLAAFQKGTFDLCIVDVMLPKMDGFTLATEIRKRNQSIPILFLTAKSLKEDRIKGLQLGADDYIVKPFSIEELILKIEIFLKRKSVAINQPQEIFQISEFSFDFANLKLSSGETIHNLTQREAELLKMLCENKPNIVKREHILEQIWGENDYFLGRSMDVFISRLRKYMKTDPKIKLENVHGVGFRLLETK